MAQGPSARRGRGRMRLRGLIRKESLQILRDPSSIAIAFVLPVILLLLFGYGVSLDAKDVPLAIVVERSSAETMSLEASFAYSDYFAPQHYTSIQAAERALEERRVDGIVWLREDFARHLLSGHVAPIGVIVDGVDANRARLIEGYVQGVWISWLTQVSRALARELPMPTRLEQRIWFNPAVSSTNFLVPGLIAVIMTLIGAMLTAMVVAREWERGTMEALMVTPVRMREILLGKLIPYFILGMGGMFLSVAMAAWLFQVPLVGSFWVLTLASALFMLTALAMGLLISIAAKNQFVAGQVAILISFLPAFMLSGFIFEISAMPQVIQWITHIVPARYFVAILQTLFLAGNIWPIVLANSAALAVMMVVFLGLARRKTHKRLDA